MTISETLEIEKESNMKRKIDLKRNRGLLIAKSLRLCLRYIPKLMLFVMIKILNVYNLEFPDGKLPVIDPYCAPE